MVIAGSQGRGSLQEGEIQYNSDFSLQPYEVSTQGGILNTQYTNYSQHWSCGEAIGIMHGLVPRQPYIFTGVAFQQPSLVSRILRRTSPGLEARTLFSTAITTITGVV